MSLRADHYDTAPGPAVERRQLRLLPAHYIDPRRHAAPDLREPVSLFRPSMTVCEEDAHSLIRQAIVEQKSLLIKMADERSVIIFSGDGSNLLVEHVFHRAHRALYSLCTAGWIVWEIYRGCSSQTLNELLSFIPEEHARPA